MRLPCWLQRLAPIMEQNGGLLPYLSQLAAALMIPSTRDTERARMFARCGAILASPPPPTVSTNDAHIKARLACRLTPNQVRFMLDVFFK